MTELSKQKTALGLPELLTKTRPQQIAAVAAMTPLHRAAILGVMPQVKRGLVYADMTSDERTATWKVMTQAQQTAIQQSLAATKKKTAKKVTDAAARAAKKVTDAAARAAKRVTDAAAAAEVDLCTFLSFTNLEEAAELWLYQEQDLPKSCSHRYKSLHHTTHTRKRLAEDVIYRAAILAKKRKNEIYLTFLSETFSKITFSSKKITFSR